jgi:hypothetical protein
LRPVAASLTGSGLSTVCNMVEFYRPHRVAAMFLSRFGVEI